MCASTASHLQLDHQEDEVEYQRHAGRAIQLVKGVEHENGERLHLRMNFDVSLIRSHLRR